jgi:hypothetical protein
LNVASGATDPAKAIMASALAGELTEQRPGDLITEAAQKQLVANYTQELRARSEPMFVQQFHRALADGGADELLDSLRPSFDKAFEKIAAAMSLIAPSGSAEQFLASAKPAALAAWQGLDGHLAQIEAIGRIAAQFGPRTGDFPMVSEYALADNYRLDDRAVIATDGPLEADSAIFRQPDQGHRTSPWCRLPLRLHTVDSAQARYNEWAASEWDRQHAGPTGSWIDDDGEAHELPRPVNPYRATKLAKR